MNQSILKILVVEDDPAHVELIRYAFEEAGSQALISMADNLNDYRRLITDDLPDIVLMDLNLPDGLALEALISPAEEGDFPILVMTAHGDEHQAVAAMKAGALDYLVKSEESFAAMPHTVSRALREWRLLRERHHVTLALVESEERYRNVYRQFHTVFEGVPDPLLLLTADLYIEWANAAALNVFGKGRDDFRGSTFSQFLHKVSGSPSQPLLQCFTTGQIDELQLDCTDGRVWTVRVLPIRETDEAVYKVLLLFQDVAHKMQTQSDAIRASQLAVLGELAAGVAHEINNPVNGVINYAQILVNRLSKDEKNRDLAERIIREGSRIATIVGNLLSFARPQEEQRQQVSIAETIMDCLTVAGAQLRHDSIVLCTLLPDNLPSVRAVKSQLQQVFLNLISNARYTLNEKYAEACPSKTIEIRGKSFREGDDDWVRLIFTDYGTGIPEVNLARVLHPFFTTKPINQGTGLGLSISHGIIKSHGGRLSIASIYGHSTVVTIDLPCFADRKQPS